MNYTEMTEARVKAISDARDYLNRAEKEQREMNAEESASYEKAMKDADSLKKRIEQREAFEQVEATLSQSAGRKVVSDDIETRKAKANAEYRGAFDAYVRRPNISPDEHRALQVGSNSEGGYLVPQTWESQLVEAITQQNVMRQIATVISTASDRNIPIEASLTTAAWCDEEGTVDTTSDSVFGTAILKAWKLQNIVKVSNELLNDAVFDVSAYVANELGRSFAIAEEGKFVAGTASQSYPTGILVSGTLGITCASATTPTFDEILGLVYSVNARERQQGVWVMGDDMILAIRKLKATTTGQYVWQPNSIIGQPDTLCGYPVYASGSCPSIAANTVVCGFGNAKKYVIADRNGKTLQRLNELYAGNGQTGFMLVERVDGKLTQADAFKTMKMHTAS